MRENGGFELKSEAVKSNSHIAAFNSTEKHLEGV
jgi:hypothetical protein